MFVGLLAAALSGCAGSDEPRAKPLTAVRVRTVAAAGPRAATRYSGTIEPAAKVDLAFKVGGYVREVAEAKGQGRKLQEGDWVTKGTVLAVVNESDYKQRIWAARASLAEAVASDHQAHLDHARARKLLDANVINQAEYDDASARRDIGSARTAAARAKLSEAELALADCTLRAPFDGVVVRRGVEVGQLAAAGTFAYGIADTRSVKVVFGAPDRVE
jgi:RND family efflux transporter MFP subunit